MLLRKKQKEKDTMSEITLQQLAAQAASIQDDLDASTAALRAAEVEAIKAIVSVSCRAQPPLHFAVSLAQSSPTIKHGGLVTRTQTVKSSI